MRNDDIPNYPFYGYDNAEELDRDVDYIKGIYPQTVRKLLKEIEVECDKLEYDGSVMFDQIPDTVSLGKLVDTIYVRVADQTFAPLKTECIRPPYHPCSGRNCSPPPYPPYPYPPHPCGPNRPCPPVPRPPRPDYDNNGSPDWMRNLISVLLYNEMIHRRRRYRSRKQWI
ncbi:MAG: hypothetical protein ACERKN_10735 [Velocimicrobium sp.]